MSFFLWIVFSIAFWVMLVLTILKKFKRKPIKKFLLITIGLFIVGLICFIIGVSSTDSDEDNSSDNKTSQTTNKSSILDDKVDSVVLDTQMNTMKTVSSMAEDETITKAQARDINDKVGSKADKIKKDIKHDSKYKSLEKKEEKGELTTDELEKFLSPYLNRIQNLQPYL